MRSLFENKRLVLSFAVLALAALTVLAISLNRVPFRESEHFTREETKSIQFSSENMNQIWAEVPIWKQIVFWTLVSLIIVLIGLLLSPEMRKRLFLLFIRMAITFWGVYFLLKNYGDRLLGLRGLGSQAIQNGGESGSPPPVFAPPQISPTFSYLISFTVALLWLAVMWGLYRGWRRYQLLNSTKPLSEIAKIARSSLDDLSSGRNSSDVIINCYLRMSDVVSHRRQLQRGIAMTPHEFAVRLEHAGLPGDAVTRLTRLFEAVRYGDRKSAPKDVTEAVNCLKTILHYCGEPI
jgi:Domain of unknown function (DUF4129)